ncbi:MAG: DUF6544 family protein, partial [Longimicrobiales bacterium]
GGMVPTGLGERTGRWGLAVVVFLHALLHLLGAAKGLGLAEVPALALPVSRLGGLAWLVAGAGLMATVYRLGSRRASWWAIGIPAATLSQVMILTAWADARWGTLINLLVLAVAAHALASRGPWSLRAAYRSEVDVRLRRRELPVPLTDADAAHLPEPVRRYLRASGAIGRARPAHLRAVWAGKIRAGSTDPWMAFTAEQYNFVDEPARFFWMSARRAGVPVDVLHEFEGGEAKMRARILSAFSVVDARGSEATRAETVTLLNDLCLLAPGALVGPAFGWEVIDGRSARVRYTVGSNAVSAVLHFDDSGDLMDFVSDDRLVASPDGRTFTPRRWSTPVSSYQSLDGVRVTRHGEGRWHPPGESPFTYIDLDLLELEVAPH